ncbi:MAG: hypothetical protein HFE90_06535 [Firmicutes bacterium]|nr:hypothetical protein [Bacillota bacterium]
MRKLKIIIIILIILSAAGFAAYYFLADNFALLSKPLESSDGSYSINVPISWKDKTSENSPATAIQAGNANDSMYTQLSYNKTSASDNTIEEYVYSYINEIAENSDDPLVQVISEAPAQTILGDNTGYYFELDTISDGLSLHIWSFVFISDGGYVHIDVAASGDKIKDSANTAKAILSSVKAQ